MTQKAMFRTKTLLIGIALGSLMIGGNVWAQNEPLARCAGYGDDLSILLTDWESGTGSWTVGTYSVANAETFSTPDWATAGDLPDNQPGMAAFVANLDIGDCGADDQAGVLTLESPAISIPGNIEVPRISFEHWFETEFDYDGGNIKISVNGGAYDIIPDFAFEFGAYNDTLAPAFDEFGVEDNTNPLAGQEAFTGTVDGGQSGSWTGVHINLLGIAAAGDTIKLRFDFGIDSCLGAIGWYVDDLEVYGCEAELPPSDCGNGVIDNGEQCDDGNDFIGDGCSNTCQVEMGWQCTDPGSPGNISDPGFEAGTPNPFWNEVSNNFIGTPICDLETCNNGGGTGPSEGDYWVWFGGARSEQQGSVSQSVVIPSSVSALTFDLEIPACDSAADYVEILIDDQPQLVIDGSNPRCGIIGYVSQSLDISAHADDREHEIKFYSETFSSNGGVSSFFIDAVGLPGSPSMCTPIGPSLTLVKKVINDDGGTAVPADWTLTATGPTGFSGAGPNVSSGEDFAAGTYNLSESGPAGYSASDWVCDGGTQDDADTITLAQGESATCTITNDDIPQASDINAGHAGAWFNPATSGQGQLIDIDPVAQFMFISWFTYTDADSANPFEQRWLTAQGTYSGNSATLELSETLGGQFNAPQAVTTLPVGEVTLTFNSCAEGSMSYKIDDEGLEGSFPLVRAIPGSEQTCQSLNGESTQAIDINAGMDGAWFDPLTSGQGFLIDSDPDGGFGNFLFVAWFTYGDTTESGQRWFTAQGGFEGSVADLVVYETTDGSFDDPRTPNTDDAGTMTIDFTDCSNAQLSYSLIEGNLEGNVAIQRAVPGAKALCEEISETD